MASVIDMRLVGMFIVASTLWCCRMSSAQDTVDYLRDIKPLLNQRCYACHGSLKQQANLRLDTGDSVRKGGDSGPAIEPGKPADSLLIERVSHADPAQRMPPDGPALTVEEVARLKAWIDRGATSPANEAPQPDPRQHWAFRAPVRPAVPAQPEWAKNPIDGFIAIKQQARGLSARPEADRATLLRRVSLDLTGLPPTRDELHAFLADPDSSAYERAVNRLLESPQYGERWARHWMDVWRYSDWYGRRQVPDVWNSAPQIWRWRDWIVQSLNGDKGYDRMVQEMLAADEICPEDDDAAVATGYLVRNWYALNPNQWMRDNVEHTAKAFLGLTLNCAHCHDHKYDPISQEEYFQFRAFFEPISLRQDRWRGEADPGPFQKYEYAVLRKIQPLGRVSVFDERPDEPTHMYVLGDERVRMNRPAVTPAAPTFLGGDRLPVSPIELPPGAWYPGLKPFVQQALLAEVEATIAPAQTALDPARAAMAPADAAFVQAELQRDAARSAVIQAALSLPETPASALLPALIDKQVAAEASLRQSQVQRDVATLTLRAAESRLAAAVAQRESLQARITAENVRYGLQSGNTDETAKLASAAERQAAVRQAESRLAQAELALNAAQQKGDPKVIAPAQTELTASTTGLEAARKAAVTTDAKYSPLSPVYPQKSTGRRKALAEWITSRTNPLTARVAVNHIWLRHFGRAIVRTVNDFGQNGAKPTHPELLDWLVVELIDSGWSQKHIHRLIVTSATYRQASTPGPKRAASATELVPKQAASTTDPAVEFDADNALYWRFPTRRLEAEAVRDVLLRVADGLDTTVGGSPLDNVKDAQSPRRSLYFSNYPEDGGHPQFLEMFDAPDPCDCYQRSETLIPQQALVLTNGELLLASSRALAQRLSAETQAIPEVDRDRAFIAAAFEQVLSRPPTNAEMQTCLEFLAGVRVPAQTAAAQGAVQVSQKSRESLIRALFNHDDFLSIR